MRLTHKRGRKTIMGGEGLNKIAVVRGKDNWNVSSEHLEGTIEKQLFRPFSRVHTCRSLIRSLDGTS